MDIDKDAFSSGQISSKIWLCEELEKLIENVDRINIYGGWYGLTSFLLLSRGKIKVRQVRSFDIDPSCEKIADTINENWVINDWTFKAFTADCSSMKEPADIVINTSTEHFVTLKWFENIPTGTWVVLQGNNMKHEDHYDISDNLHDFTKKFNLSTVYYSGEKRFVYPDWEFIRYMLIGIK